MLFLKKTFSVFGQQKHLISDSREQAPPSHRTAASRQLICKMADLTKLSDIAREFHLKADKLVKKARSLGVPVTLADAKRAVELNTGQQVLKPPPRSVGKTAATGPGKKLMGDPIDFSQNTDAHHKYSLLIADVFTRMLYEKTLENKTASAVADATEERAFARHPRTW